CAQNGSPISVATAPPASTVEPASAGVVSPSDGSDDVVEETSLTSGEGEAMIGSGALMCRLVSTVERKSSLPRPNSRMARPNIRPSSGSREGPNTRSAMTPMTTISWRPMSNMGLEYHAGLRGSCDRRPHEAHTPTWKAFSVGDSRRRHEDACPWEVTHRDAEARRLLGTVCGHGRPQSRDASGATLGPRRPRTCGRGGSRSPLGRHDLRPRRLLRLLVLWRHEAALHDLVEERLVADLQQPRRLGAVP